MNLTLCLLKQLKVNLSAKRFLHFNFQYAVCAKGYQNFVHDVNGNSI